MIFILLDHCFGDVHSGLVYDIYLLFTKLGLNLLDLQWLTKTSTSTMEMETSVQRMPPISLTVAGRLT